MQTRHDNRKDQKYFSKNYEPGLLNFGYLKEQVLDVTANLAFKYFKYCKKHPNIGLATNLTMSMSAGAVVGYLSADATEHFTSNENIISFNSTTLDWLVDTGVFLQLNKKSNKKYLKKNGDFNRQLYSKDSTIASIAFIVIDVTYVLSKYLIMKEQIDNGMDSGNASVLADLYLGPITTLASYFIAKQIISTPKKNKNPRRIQKFTPSNLFENDSPSPTCVVLNEYPHSSNQEDQQRIFDEDNYNNQILQNQKKIKPHNRQKNYPKFRKQERRL